MKSAITGPFSTIFTCTSVFDKASLGSDPEHTSKIQSLVIKTSCVIGLCCIGKMSNAFRFLSQLTVTFPLEILESVMMNEEGEEILFLINVYVADPSAGMFLAKNVMVPSCSFAEESFDLGHPALR
jgi:hypothetical protein